MTGALLAHALEGFTTSVKRAGGNNPAKRWHWRVALALVGDGTRTVEGYAPTAHAARLEAFKVVRAAVDLSSVTGVA